MDRTRRSGCGDCTPFRAKRPAPRARPDGEHPFFALLGEMARAFEGRAAAPAATGFRREVERHVEPLLPAGSIRMEEVARALNCSRQTLYRRLKAEGVTFEELLDALRRRLALRLVRAPGLSVKEIAYRLGFSEPAAFSRAFKRWTGRTPQQARSRHSG
jgi:AraC-like DNA-binding protein